MNNKSRPKAAPETTATKLASAHMVTPLGGNVMMDAALDLVEHGWSVLPCHPSGPLPKAPIKDLVEHGHLDASRDPAVITEWWTRRPRAMIGAVVPASLVVLDVDPRNGGSLEGLQAVLGPLPPTLTCISGRNDHGCHLYYLRPTGALVSTRLPNGVDLKQTGYLIVPPSLHPDSGEPYRWINREAVKLPPRAVGALRSAPSRPPSSIRVGHRADGLIQTVVKAAEGNRNRALYWAARRAVEEGHGPDVFDALEAAGQTVGLDPAEVRATIRSATRQVIA